jgi:hypothetical protein
MSLLRIIYGVLIGICLLAGFLDFAWYFPTVALSLVFCSMGVFALYLVSHGLQNGVIRAKGARYGRSSNPFGFWFCILFYTAFGLFFCALAYNCLFNH